jgi:hypothetical protein
MSSSNGVQFSSQAPDQRLFESGQYSFALDADDFTDASGTISYSASQPGGAALPSWISFNRC